MVQNVSFELMVGDLGFSGLMGAGRTGAKERALFAMIRNRL